jgi:DMSO/TMAO reductase YedYZ heme-binding membrane subunit
MDQQSEQRIDPGASSAGGMTTGDLNYPAIAVMVGGFLAAAGVFLKWFSYSLPGLTVRVNGTEDFTGVAALILGVLTIACGAAMMMNDENMQRAGRTVGVVSAVLTLLFVLYGLTRAADAIGNPAAIAQAAGGLQTGLAFGIWVSAVGSIIAVVGATLAMKGRSLSS